MDSMDNFRERFEVLAQRTEQLKHQTRTGERRRWRLTWSVAAMVILGLALARPYVVRAKTFHCSAGDVQCLIDAINEANANGTKNRIRLEAGTYTLTAVDNDTDGRNGLPSLTSPRPMTIQGAGAESTIIERDPSALGFRLFHVAATGVLTLHGLTLRRGTIDSGRLLGGGIWNLGTLTIRHSTLAGNMAATNLDNNNAAGGGIYNVDGKVTLKESTLDGNQTRAGFGSSGGGLYNAGGTVHIIRSTLRDNMALGGRAQVGGGLYNLRGTVTLTDSVLTGNTAGDGRFSRGGGIANDDTLTVTNTLLTNNTTGSGSGGGISNNGMLIVTQSTFTSNHAQNGQGGGLRSSGTVRITTSTFADNTAFGGGASEGGQGGGLSVSGTGSLTNTTVGHNSATTVLGPGRGGGLEVSGVVTLTNCTIAENVADSVGDIIDFQRSQGGGLYAGASSTVHLQNTILARNGSQVAMEGPDCFGPLTSLGTNLIGDPTGCTITLQPTDLTGAPGLDTFKDNGRPGNGHFPLLPDSPAIDAGNDAVCPRRDQLGRRRVGPCDIGAIEFRDRDKRQHDKADKQHDGDPAAAAQASQ